MKKITAFIAVLAAASTAYAQEDGGGKFSHNAEYRVRYQYDQNITGDKDVPPSSQDNVVQRFKFGTTFKASEKISATLTLLHNSSFGSNDLGGSAATGHNDATGDDKGILSGTNNAENMILVHEAYGTWVVSDDLNIKFGRGNAGIADGALIGENDWQANPYSYEGVVGTYEHESFQLQAWGVRFAEWDRGVSPNHGDDPEANSFGVAFDFKSLPEFLNMANVHVIQNTVDEVFSNTDTAIIPKENTLRYGLVIGGETAGVDYKVNYEAETGETELAAAKTDVEGSMYQVELGYSMPEVMNSRFYVLYHSDSGDGNSTDTKDETYDPYFYELHENAGLMDVVMWGNLTYISLGYTFEPMEDTMVGIHYHMFSKTEKEDSVSAGANGGAILQADDLGNTTTAAEEKIGDEIDLVASKKYDSNFMLTTRLGMFMPADAIKDAGGAGNGPSDTYTQVFVEGKMTF